jgi:hypothetical protein
LLLVISPSVLTANLNSRGSFLNIYIKELNNKKLVVNCETGKFFDYTVFGIRKGYKNFEAVSLR